MAIDRISGNPMAPLITQRLDVSNATALVPDRIQPLVPIGPFMAATPDPGLGLTPGQASAALGQNAPGLPGAAPADATLAEAAAVRDSGAMQANQLFFSRQLVWHAPDTAALAASWQVMVKTYGAQRAAVQEQARGQHMPGNLFMAEPNPNLREGARGPQASDAEAWRFAVYGWGGQRLTLRVLASDPDQPAPRRRRRTKVALRLELMLGEAGLVVIQMEPSVEGVALELTAREPAALELLRARLPQLAEAVGRSGLRIVRCRIGATPRPVQPSDHPPANAAIDLSPPVFRAMAEVAMMLSRPPEQESAAAQPAPSGRAAEAALEADEEAGAATAAATEAADAQRAAEKAEEAAPEAAPEEAAASPEQAGPPD
jgi:hypothetical protein